MSQTTEIEIINQAGAPFRAAMNNMLSALNTDFAGTTAPSVTEADMVWLDTSTSPAKLKKRNSSNTSWDLHPLQVIADDSVLKSTSNTMLTGTLGIGASPLHSLDAVKTTISGGNPASTGSAADPNVAVRIQPGSSAIDWGVFSTGAGWIQNRQASDYSQFRALSLNPLGGDVAIGASPTTGVGRLQVTRPGIGGTPATSGVTDNNQIAELGSGTAHFRIGMYSSGGVWMQPSLGSSYATNNNLTLCPNGGSVSVGINDSSAAKFVVNGNVSYTIPTTFAGATGNGSWTTGQASQVVPLSIYASDRIFASGVYTASDRRVKDNITAIPEDGALDFCRNVETCEFDWSVTGLHDTGFIAQDLLAKGYGHLVSGIPDATLDEFVDENGNVSPAGTKLIARYEAAIPILTAAIRALDRKNSELEERIFALESISNK